MKYFYFLIITKISIYGGNFWKGAQKAFLLLMENSQR